MQISPEIHFNKEFLSKTHSRLVARYGSIWRLCFDQEMLEEAVGVEISSHMRKQAITFTRHSERLSDQKWARSGHHQQEVLFT